jgi:hypothetical protein
MNVCLHEGMKLQAMLVQAVGLLLKLMSSKPLHFGHCLTVKLKKSQPLSMGEFEPRTTWSLSNAFTSAFKELDPIPRFKATAKLGGFLEARFSGLF